MSPTVPAFPKGVHAPNDWAASSNEKNSIRFRDFRQWSDLGTSAKKVHRQYGFCLRGEGRIHFFGIDILNVWGSISTNTGFAPRRAIAPAVEKNVKGAVTTSSPDAIPGAMRARSNASVPEDTPIAYRALQ